MGELSLAGEIRPVRGLRQRMKTAKELGFDTVLVPGNETGAVSIKDIKGLIGALFK